jgi:hypothetical protein
VYLGLGDAARAKADLEVARKADANIDAQVKKAGLPSAPAATP